MRTCEAPQTTYGISKLAAEKFAQIAAESHEFSIAALRPFNVYGPRKLASSSSVVNKFIKKVLANEPLLIQGDGTQTRDFVHVSDVVQAFLGAKSFCEKGDFHFLPIDVCTGVSTSILDLGSAIEEAANRRARYLHVPARENDPQFSSGSVTNMQKLLCVKPTIDFPAGISSLVEHYADKLAAGGLDLITAKEVQKDWFHRRRTHLHWPHLLGQFCSVSEVYEGWVSYGFMPYRSSQYASSGACGSSAE